MQKRFKDLLPTSLLSLPYLTNAQNTLHQPASGVGTTLQEFVMLLIEIMQMVVFPFLVVCIIYAGFVIVTAGGNEDQISKGKRWIIWTLVGAAIIIAARVIADIIFGTADLFS